MQHAFGAGDEGRNTHGIFIRKEGRSMARASLRIKIVFLSDEKPSVQFFGKLSDGRLEVIPCRMAKSPLYKRPSGGACDLQVNKCPKILLLRFANLRGVVAKLRCTND